MSSPAKEDTPPRQAKIPANLTPSPWHPEQAACCHFRSPLPSTDSMRDMPMTHHWIAAPTRRRVLTGAAATGALAFAPAVVRAQTKTPKIAVLLPRSGYLAQAGQ